MSPTHPCSRTGGCAQGGQPVAALWLQLALGQAKIAGKRARSRRRESRGEGEEKPSSQAGFDEVNGQDGLGQTPSHSLLFYHWQTGGSFAISSHYIKQATTFSSLARTRTIPSRPSVISLPPQTASPLRPHTRPKRRDKLRFLISGPAQYHVIGATDAAPESLCCPFGACSCPFRAPEPAQPTPRPCVPASLAPATPANHQLTGAPGLTLDR